MALNVVNSVVGTTRTLASGDELIVTRDGVIAVDIGHGISVPHSDPFGIHIEGSVYATWAPLLINGDDTASYTSNIIVADTGIIRSFYNFYTVAIQRNGVDFENNGEITAAEASAILFYSGVDTGSLVNRGTITAYDDAFSFLGDALDATIDTFFVTNHGHMEGGSNVVSGRYENMDVVNTGTMVSEDRAVVMIRAAVQGVQPALSLNNLGLIQTTDAVEVVYGGFGHDEVINRGMIVGVVELDSGNDRVLNHGDIVGDVRLDNGSDYVFNAGTIQGDIYMGPGGDLLINWGGIDGNVDMGSTSMYTVVVRNTGHIEGSVTLGGASDKYYGLGGTASGTVYLGSGFDTAYVDQHGVVISGGADDDYVYAYDDVFVDAVEVVYARGALDVAVSVLQGPSTAYGNIGNNHFVNSGQHSVAFYGRSGDDRLEAGTSGDTLDGGAGHDVLIGGTGVDTMTGAAGDDELLGDAGGDSLWGGHGDDTLSGGTGDDRIYGGESADLMFGENDQDTLSGGAGNDTAYGGTGNDRLYGGEDDDLLSGQNGNDTLSGGTGDDAMLGGNNNDQLFGNEGRDLLFGDSGDDSLNGGTEDDVLVGGLGIDVMTGGHGNDVFVFLDAAESTDAARDTVLDFVRGEDLIDLSAVSAQTMGFVGNAGFTGGGAASVRYALNVAGNAVVSVDSDGDAVMDMRFVINAQTALDAGDFIL